MTGLEQTAPEKETQPVEMPDDEVLYELADLFRVFGDSTRIKILYALHDSELCVQDIADAVQLSQSAVSHQLRVLKDSKLVRFRREGKTVFYALDDDHVRAPCRTDSTSFLYIIHHFIDISINFDGFISAIRLSRLFVTTSRKS